MNTLTEKQNKKLEILFGRISRLMDILDKNFWVIETNDMYAYDDPYNYCFDIMHHAEDRLNIFIEEKGSGSSDTGNNHGAHFVGEKRGSNKVWVFSTKYAYFNTITKSYEIEEMGDHVNTDKIISDLYNLIRYYAEVYDQKIGLFLKEHIQDPEFQNLQ